MHFKHDGCICGYDQENKTFCIYSYDKNWVYQKFWTPQKSFDAGRKAQFNKGQYGIICGIKPKETQVDFSYKIALEKITEYLDSTMEKYPETGKGLVYGIVVHDYISKYVEKLYNQSIPYNRLDRRIFRLIWEHKKAMQEMIKMIEEALSLDNSTSNAYKKVVDEANNCRMLYAIHHMKQRPELLPIIQKKLLGLKSLEQELLYDLLEKTKGGNK